MLEKKNDTLSAKFTLLQEKQFKMSSDYDKLLAEYRDLQNENEGLKAGQPVRENEKLKAEINAMNETYKKLTIDHNSLIEKKQYVRNGI